MIAFLVTPVLVEFERGADGVQMTIWTDYVPKLQFQAKVNGTNFVFHSTRVERYVFGKWVQGFKAFPEGSERYQSTDLSLCPTACLGGSLRLPREEIESSRSKMPLHLLGGQQNGFVPRPGI